VLVKAHYPERQGIWTDCCWWVCWMVPRYLTKL